MFVKNILDNFLMLKYFELGSVKIKNIKNISLKIKTTLNTKNLLEALLEALTDQKKVIVLCGPTCTGKTKLSLILAETLNTNIVSVDSMQAYNKMDIGTDKYNTDELGIKQFMVNLYNPDYNMTVVEFRDRCREIIEKEFFDKKKVPILVGGSGLYIRAVVDDLNFTNQNISTLSVRQEILKEIENLGSEKVYEKLKKIDPTYAYKISKNDIRRIVRALEVYQITGNTFSSFQNSWNERKSIYNCIFIGLSKTKDKLNECIEKRVEKMLNLGLIDEVKKLIEEGYENCISLSQAVGYKEVIKYLKGYVTLDECKDEIIKNTKKLAKKQFTWFKADPRINWIQVDNYDNICDLINDVFNIISVNLN